MTTATTRETVFSRVLVGIDGSPEALEAARQAAALLEPSGSLELVESYDLASALAGGLGLAPAYLDEASERERVTNELAEAAAQVRGAVPTTKIGRGRPWEVLIEEAKRDDYTAIVVGSYGTGRTLGIVIGSTATEVLHKAPCSVLVARTGGAASPATIVVGVDGSPESAQAYETARHLANRFDYSQLRALVALGGKEPDAAAVERVAGQNPEQALKDPVEALVDESERADLVIVGSRGLHGVRALGSVSERVAHQAHCSVLVVR
jgi:nucleotide-binding universal stress UspA family protein